MDIALARQLASFEGAILILVAYAEHQMGLDESQHSCVQRFERDWFVHSRLYCDAYLSDRLRGAGKRMDAD